MSTALDLALVLWAAVSVVAILGLGEAVVTWRGWGDE